MKPILYESNETVFGIGVNYGLGTLSDVESCIVTEERNGKYELEMEYPVDGIHYEEIKHGFDRIIYAKPADGKDPQPFRIYNISTPANGSVTVSAEHISYQLVHIPCMGFTARTVAGALAGLKDNATENCPFTFWTDKTTTADYSQSVPASIRSRLGGTKGSVLDLYGGEYEWDTWTVKLHANRGSDRGASILYGKNLTDLKQEESIANTITGVVPYYVGTDDELVTLPEKAVYSENASNFPYKRTKVVDFSSEFENTPTVAQLRAKAQAYISASGVGVPTVNLKVSFVALWQTEEYKDIAVLERVNLCDTVTVKFEKLGVNVKAKVVKTVYDSILERYNSIEIGEGSSSFSEQVSSIESSVEQQPSMTDLQRAVATATALIQGGLGGHVVFNTNANGEPEEILIMDTASKDTATKVWRWNKDGLGYSSTGYQGPYGLAMTSNGQIVADYIATGKISGITIQGNTITGNVIDGNTITGTAISGGTITGSVITNGNNFSVDASGLVTMYNGFIRFQETNPQTGDVSYIDTTRGSAQFNLVKNNEYFDEYGDYIPEVSGHLKPDGLTFVTREYGGMSRIYQYPTNYTSEGFNIAGGVVCEVDVLDEGPPKTYTARLRTDRIYTANDDPQNASFTIFNNTSEDQSSYACMFQSDGNLVIYDLSTTPWTPVWSAWNP